MQSRLAALTRDEEPTATRVQRDVALVERARSGDEAAFADLVTVRLDSIYRLAGAILGNEADARDVAQEAFLSVWTNLPRLRDASRFDAWLHRSVVNRCRDALRHRGRVREIRLEAEQLTVADAADASADIAAVSAAFDRLSLSEREILTLHHLEDMPVAELARRLAIPIGTAKWRLHAARRALERALEAER